MSYCWWLNRWMVYRSNDDEDNFNETVLRTMETFSEKKDIPLVIYYLIRNYTDFCYFKYDSNYPPTPTSSDEEGWDLW